MPLLTLGGCCTLLVFLAAFDFTAAALRRPAFDLTAAVLCRPAFTPIAPRPKGSPNMPAANRSLTKRIQTEANCDWWDRRAYHGESETIVPPTTLEASPEELTVRDEFRNTGVGRDSQSSVLHRKGTSAGPTATMAAACLQNVSSMEGSQKTRKSTRKRRLRKPRDSGLEGQVRP